MAYGSDLASEIKDTDNPEQVLRNPEAYKNDLSVMLGIDKCLSLIVKKLSNC